MYIHIYTYIYICIYIYVYIYICETVRCKQEAIARVLWIITCNVQLICNALLLGFVKIHKTLAIAKTGF